MTEGSNGVVRPLSSLRIAAVMDEFTLRSYEPECNVLQLSVGGWRYEVADFEPDLLFVESAWNGKDGGWSRKVSQPSVELLALLDWSTAHGVPTVFWNKEDPVHFNTFLNTAALFDHVFTTDIDCIGRYKRALGHGRVHLLPFACQPRSFNPLDATDRIDAFCFAGGYYRRYPERARDLQEFASTLTELKPIVIYDRHYGGSDENYAFPPEYAPFILGSLPFGSIQQAYKGYGYGLNLNSVKHSQSMCARRVYELMASNTVVVSNYSRAMRNLFGDLALMSDSGSQIVKRLKSMLDEETAIPKLRLAALREVMRQHTYSDRIRHVARTVGIPVADTPLPHVSVVGYARDLGELESLKKSYERQGYPETSLDLVVANGIGDDDFSVVPVNEVSSFRELHLRKGHVAVISPDDYYGPNYLWDLVLATRFSDAEVVGKAARYVWSAENESIELEAPEMQYVSTDHLEVRCSLISSDLVPEGELSDWLEAVDDGLIVSGSCLAIDPFNYCAEGGLADLDPRDEAFVDDLGGLDTGVGMDWLMEVASGIPPDQEPHLRGSAHSGQDVASWFGTAEKRSVLFKAQSDGLGVESSLAEGLHEYIWSDAVLEPADLALDSRGNFHVETSPGLDIRLALKFIGVGGESLGSEVIPSNANETIRVPKGTNQVRPGLRVYGPGSGRLDRIVLGSKPVEPQTFITKNRHLIVTNQYPSYDDLYRNAFLHRRVLGYRQKGVPVDVYRIREDQDLSFHEFEGVDVASGSRATLSQFLRTGHYESVVVHFLNRSTWEVLEEFTPNLRVAIWIHGVEIQPWSRRSFNYDSADDMEAVKRRSDERMEFWRSLLSDIPEDVKLVFVSRSFADEVMEDYAIRIPDDQLEIIHNPIDTGLFSFEAKLPEQRKKILSIRSFASPKYANDLTVETILELSRRPGFDELEFRVMGDGPLFEETVEPLSHLDNVIVERRFLHQEEIARINREYGVFLCPTRWDSQGVSRDEAMSSGLVAVTNRVAAVPEFVDDSCAIVAPPEDSQAMADGIQRLIEDPSLFLSLSEAGARRVRQQSAIDLVLDQELSVILEANDFAFDQVS